MEAVAISTGLFISGHPHVSFSHAFSFSLTERNYLADLEGQLYISHQIAPFLLILDRK
jgi:hypothetical protein